ncbi:Zn-ribbon domain-containing OB-fold protein [Rhodococcus sp. NCIMB 12038]|uniref:Zn-ribbon domain-containing OB-fold protein n=1 Tax=Rhodococcus sp. NCIMB 12038 TaxID=933800 RepID=UPI000B3C2518|nr:OB-fold domain-containing protein [Rhodococcus sp. NCIMB 12038]OUS94283.1 hypothetical protein CA951_17885 [Rhodococcus sp. NCIMB 12038]
MSALTPEVTDLNRPFWDGVADARLRYQHCTECGHNWLPAREECPACLQRAGEWADSAGKGELVSWVVYHRSFHPTFDDLVPYAVAVIELAEGPRMIAGLRSALDELTIDAEVDVHFGEHDGVAIPYFTLTAK